MTKITVAKRLVTKKANALNTFIASWNDKDIDAHYDEMLEIGAHYDEMLEIAHKRDDSGKKMNELRDLHMNLVEEVETRREEIIESIQKTEEGRWKDAGQYVTKLEEPGGVSLPPPVVSHPSPVGSTMYGLRPID